MPHTPKTSDFRWMYQGSHLEFLSPKDAGLLKPVTCRDAKSDRALLMLHGFSSSPAVFRHLTPLLPRYDGIFCPVLPGHAESITAFDEATASDWVQAADEAMVSLLQQYRHVDVLGLSLGGLLACHLANHHAVAHLYLLAPALAIHVSTNIMIPLTGFLKRIGFERLRTRAGDIRSDRHPEIAYRQLPLSSILEVLKLVRDFAFSPPACPADVFLGRKDSVVNSPVVAGFFENLPNVTIHWLENSAHVLPLDNDVSAIANRMHENASAIPTAKILHSHGA